MPDTRVRRRVRSEMGGELITKQSDALKSDINQIMARYITHGVVPLVGATPTYGDFSNVDDYHTALNKVKAAQDSFMELPAAVRGHVDNDPGKFLDMVFDADRSQELVDLGLIPERIPEAAPVPKPEPKPEPPGQEPAPE